MTALRHVAIGLEDRFWSKVDVREPDECWPWTASRLQSGYGMFWAGGRTTAGHPRSTPAHRIAWELTHGPIPEGKLVCHTCDQPECCNPVHLFIGTYTDNVADMDAKGRRRVVTKLTEDSVREIPRLWAWDDLLQREVAQMFGISQTTVGFIVRGGTWGLDACPRVRYCDCGCGKTLSLKRISGARYLNRVHGQRARGKRRRA
jgi:hypothetical protein